VHTIATNYVIQPFVGLVELGALPKQVPPSPESSAAIAQAGEPLARWRTSAEEVEEVLELTLAEIVSGRGRTHIERRGIRFETDTFTVGAHVIWGATFRILDDLLARLHQAA